jgi:hypothetical protein
MTKVHTSRLMVIIQWLLRNTVDLSDNLPACNTISRTVPIFTLYDTQAVTASKHVSESFGNDHQRKSKLWPTVPIACWIEGWYGLGAC